MCLSHYGKLLCVVAHWAQKENRHFYRPVYHRQWLVRIEHYLTFFNLPTHQLRHFAYRLWETQPTRAYASISSTLPAPSSNTSGRRLVNADIPGWLPRMNRISKLLRGSLLRYTPAPLNAPTRPERDRSRRHKRPQSAHFRTVPSPTWAFTLNWSMQTSTPLVEAWFAAPTSVDQRSLIGTSWPAEWPKTSLITTRNNTDPGNYNRKVLAGSKQGPCLLFLYDLIQEALTSGELTTDPPFPPFSASAQTRRDQGIKTNFVPYEAAAVSLIFTPIEILRRQYSFKINPINHTRDADFPPSIVPFAPRLETFTHMCHMMECFHSFWNLSDADAVSAVEVSHDWAIAQMNLNRAFPCTEFPDPPADIPGPPSDAESESDIDFDEIIIATSDSDSDSNDTSPAPPPRAPPASFSGRGRVRNAAARRSRKPQDGPPAPAAKRRRP